MTKEFNPGEYFQRIADISTNFCKSTEYQQAIELLLKCRDKNGTIFAMGCGGSAATASHFAADLAKTTIVPEKKRFKVTSLVDNTSLISAWTNDSGWNSIFVEQLEPWLTKRDVLIGFSVHGGSGHSEAGPWSQNLVQAINLAKRRGAKVIGLAGFGGGEMKKLADVCLTVPIDSEPYGTPIVEAIHGVIHHAIIFDLKERIKSRK